eukprot:CAMPEP_0114313228 /NCGR_PEP_ID=MMETSP0059-20121206/20971_1 /TAXON_ID=36894 /ORGANISM="Pyramimonas parkeae, Strain CCMP726" /LENGTH=44 /DNA_ID= /DNA_START= /DNA_END= /DNA_ORIENTATION=
MSVANSSAAGSENWWLPCNDATELAVDAKVGLEAETSPVLGRAF